MRTIRTSCNHVYFVNDEENSWSKAEEPKVANDFAYMPVNDSKRLIIHLETDDMLESRQWMELRRP